MAQEFVRRLVGRDGQIVEIIVQAPEIDTEVWCCLYRINGLGSPGPQRAMGADAIQAIILALTQIATTLYYSEEYENGELAWEEGGTAVDLGLPVAESVRDDIEAKKIRVQKLIQAKGSIP